MKHLEIVVEADKDGVLRLEIPVDNPNAKYHLLVHVEPVAAENEVQTEYLSDEFINATAGQWVGELQRPPQGDYEEREPL